MATTFALRFIAGQYKGGSFPLRPNREIIIGRGSEFDMVLDEDMVSRRHTKIATYHGQIVIQDLKSTNGTFVNGERVSVARLKVGDRILVGSSLMEIVTVDGTGVSQVPRTAPPEEAPKTLDAPQIEPPLSPTNELPAVPTQAGSSAPPPPPIPVAAPAPPPPPPPVDRSEGMSGRFPEDIESVADLVEIFVNNRRNGALILTDENHHEGRMFFRDGEVYYATIARPTRPGAESVEIPPLKNFYRQLAWTSGTFKMTTINPMPTFEEEIEGKTQQLLMDGMRQYDELKRYEPHLPKAEQHLTLAVPLEPRLSALSAEALDTLQVAINCVEFSLILDYSEASDLETCQDILYLLQNGYLLVSDP